MFQCPFMVRFNYFVQKKYEKNKKNLCHDENTLYEK